jgi:hypothetical protein
MGLLKKITETPEKLPHYDDSKWVRIHLTSGKSCLGFYSYKEDQWREFSDIQDLSHTSLLNTNTITGWN